MGHWFTNDIGTTTSLSDERLNSMDKSQIQFHLVKLAKGSGGDRYYNDDHDWTIYVPQEFSRNPLGQSKSKITISIVTEEC